MGSRERRRAERRKRKARGSERDATPAAPSPADQPDPVARGYAKAEERNRAEREALVPLREGERPLVVTIGAVISVLIAASIVGAYAAGVEVDGERPELVQVAAPALLMGVMAWGMWRGRYWAVLGFQVILLFLLFATAFGLVQAANAAQVAGNVALLLAAGTFFYFMVKAMARIQMPSRLPRD